MEKKPQTLSDDIMFILIIILLFTIKYEINFRIFLI